MKPTTKPERRAEQLSLSVKDPAPDVREWGFSRLIPNHATLNPGRSEVSCFSCGRTWREELPSACPYCGAKLKVHPGSRRRVFTDTGWYGVVQRVEEFTLIRIFFIKVTQRKDAGRDEVFSEVLQHWIDPSGRDTIRARTLGMNSYYRLCPFNLRSEMSIKRDRVRYGYRNPFLHIRPDVFHPKMECTGILRRNGFRGSFHGMNPEDALRLLLTDNRFETLWKLKRWGWAERYIFPERDRISRHWKAVLRCPPVAPADTSLYLDTMDLLDESGIPSVHWNVPSRGEVVSLHDRLQRRKEERLAREELAEIRRKEKDKLRVLESKSPYFGITFGNGKMDVIVLKSLEDYMEEGRRMHHCVFVRGYYGKEGTLVLSARMKSDPGKPVETVEISLRDGSVLQCFGPCNRFTPHHEEILSLVKANAWRFTATS